MATIVIDPGHGGYDIGGAYFGRQEKDDNLRFSLALADYLRRHGERVVLTRSGDYFVPLLNRSAISNSAGANLFVSIHRNAFALPSANGMEIYTRAYPSAVEVRDASLILSELLKVPNVFRNRGIHRADFSVLRNTRAPALLIELGFISNEQDNQIFDTRFNELVEAVGKGILEAVGGAVVPPQGGDATVRQIQSTLNSRYNAGLIVDGIAGSLTKNALVRALQQEYNTQFNAGLTVDGIFGPRTRSAMRLFRQGSRGNIVWLIQAALYLKGERIAVDGIFGPLTDSAVRRFQASHGLSVDGIVGPNTFEALFT
ncbi:MAG: N-acetylmuramoyl-L-alanine amidase [Firmicutes bacterium]|nr:N-acetylmuramoyl-L-alanine amidase [Bacillota bacterium]